MNNMNEDDELTDEQVEDVLNGLAEAINRLKRKAEAIQSRKNKRWYTDLLKLNKPSEN